MKKIENLIIEITSKCNLKCIHCGYQNIEDAIISVEDIKSIITKCIPLGLKMVMLSGGEPTLYNSLKEILLFCKTVSLKTKIATNGYNLSSIRHLLEENLIDQIIISIDAFNASTYTAIRGVNLLQKIWNDYDELILHREKIHFSFLIQQKNYLELLPFLYKCKQKNVKSISLLVPHLDGDFTGTIPTNSYVKSVFLSELDIDLFKKNISNSLKNFYHNNPEIFSFGPKHIQAIIQYLSAMPEQLRDQTLRTSGCSLPLKTLFIYANKSVRMCPYHNEWTFPNIDDFLKNIQQNRMKAIFTSKERNSYCRYCLEVPLDVAIIDSSNN